MLRPEVERHVTFWSYLGAASGAGLGFIIGNLPGLMLGAYGGKRLGAIRDAKGTFKRWVSGVYKTERANCR